MLVQTASRPPQIHRRPQPRAQGNVTTNLVDLLEDAPGRFNDRLRDIYLNRDQVKGESKLARTRQVVTRGCRRYCDLAAPLCQSSEDREMLKELKSAVLKGRHDQAVGLARTLAKSSEGKLAKICARIGAHQNEMYCLEALPRQMADGLFRPVDFYTPPGALQGLAEKQGWDLHPQTGLPIADTVVIGAGPGGLATSYNAALRGLRTVTFEAQTANQAFSDANAQAVHSLRTGATASNLIRTGHGISSVTHPLNLSQNLGEIRGHAAEARQDWNLATGQNIQVPPESTDPEDRNAPAARAEFFEHSCRVAQALVDDFPHAFFCEHSPVESVIHEDGLYTITTARGHRIHTRELVVSTGFVGTHGQHARILPQFQKLSPERFLVLEHDRELAEKSEQLLDNKHLVVADRLLGHRSVQEAIERLPDGSRVAVIGSGESAVKAVLEVLQNHPGLNVDFYAKNRLEAAQTQLPNENLHPAVTETRRLDPAYKQLAGERMESFGSPVTPRSLREIFEFVADGRLELHEMGTYFNQDSARVEEVEEGLRISIKDPEVLKHLEENESLYRSAGLEADTPAATTTVQMVINAVGYQYSELPLNPLAQSLVEQGLASVEGRQLKAENPSLHFNSAGNPAALSDSSIPGLAVAGRQLAEHLVTRCPERESQAPPIPPDGVYWPDTPPEVVDGIVQHRGLHPNFVENAKRNGGPWERGRLLFPGGDTYLLQLHVTDPEQLSPAERLVLERGRTLAHRMSNEDE